MQQGGGTSVNEVTKPWLMLVVGTANAEVLCIGLEVRDVRDAEDNGGGESSKIRKGADPCHLDPGGDY